VRTVVRTVRCRRSERVSHRPSARPPALASAPARFHVLGSVAICCRGLAPRERPHFDGIKFMVTMLWLFMSALLFGHRSTSPPGALRRPSENKSGQKTPRPERRKADALN